MYLGLNEPSDFLSGLSRDPGSVLALIEARNSRPWNILVKDERSSSAPDVGDLLYRINTDDHKCSCFPFNSHWIVKSRHRLCHVPSFPQPGIVWEGNSAEGVESASQSGPGCYPRDVASLVTLGRAILI
jgi:hypothetical protein